MTHPNRWKTRSLEAPILCDFTHCAHGGGQAGNGRCPGDWTKPWRKCTEFVTHADYEAQMKRVSAADVGVEFYDPKKKER